MRAKIPDSLPDYRLEHAAGPHPVCGVDEVGRGPWAGPIIAAAAIVNPAMLPAGVQDSKKLSAAKRDALAVEIWRVADIGLGAASVTEIDRFGLTEANARAMRRAVAHLRTAPAFALIDGRIIPPDLPCPAEAIIKGDGRSLSIAAASIVAKTTRDRLMRALAARWPDYGWERNAGYGVKAHKLGLLSAGVTPLTAVASARLQIL